jgi:hypothetical protein
LRATAQRKTAAAWVRMRDFLPLSPDDDAVNTTLNAVAFGSYRSPRGKVGVIRLRRRAESRDR